MTIFYGWVIVAVGAIVSAIGLGVMASLGVFLQPMSEAMGWSRAGISMAAMLNWLGMGVGSLLWGALSDRIGSRAVVLSGGVLLGAGLVFASRAATLGQFQILFGVLVGVAVGSFYAPMIALTTRWFTRHRSLAVALVSAGTALGPMSAGPVTRWMITDYGWRTAMLVMGDVAWLIIIPAAFLVRNAPVLSDTTAPATVPAELTAAQVLRSRQFAAIALTHFACCAAHSGPIFHMVTNAMDHGVAAMVAASVLSAAGLAAMGGRILCGLIADRVGAKRTLLAGLAIQAIAVSLYLVTRDLASFYLVALVFGFAYGGVMPLYAVLVREYFGERVMGTAFGAVAFIATMGMALGPWAGGWLYDVFGNYFWLFIGSAGIGLGAIGIAVTFRPPDERVGRLSTRAEVITSA